MIPSLGRVVAYTLTAHDAEQINRRRADAQATIAAIRAGQRVGTGEQIHVGNQAQEGDVFPLYITRVWTDADGGPVNGQVFLDGNDSLWVTSATQGEGPRRYQPIA